VRGDIPVFLLPNALLVVLEQGQAQPVITPEVVAGNRVALHAANQPPDTALYWRVSGDWKPCAGPGKRDGSFAQRRAHHPVPLCGRGA
jgi:hypothetical protein